MLKKPLILARKQHKLPGDLIEKSYGLEYGKDSLAIQVNSIAAFKKFVIVDDLLATGGTAKCVLDILRANKSFSFIGNNRTDGFKGSIF